MRVYALVGFMVVWGSILAGACFLLFRLIDGFFCAWSFARFQQHLVCGLCPDKSILRMAPNIVYNALAYVWDDMSPCSMTMKDGRHGEWRPDLSWRIWRDGEIVAQDGVWKESP